MSFSQQPGSGSTIKFDGISNRIIHDPLFNSEELPLTISYWFRLDDAELGGRLFASCYTSDNTYYGFSSHYLNNGININYGDGKGALNPAFRRGKKYFFSADISKRWIHVAISVRGPSDMSIYINGIDQGGAFSGSGGEMAIVSNCSTIIGYATDNNGEHFLKGQVDEIRVWNYSLTAEEIRNKMTKKLLGNESGLLGYWNFDEGSGTEAMEIISENKGAIQGDVNWELSGAPIGDESFYEYFAAGTKKKLFKHAQDSFWISTEEDNWIGYHVYKVNESPNTDTGSTIDLSNGYYGIYPIFENEESGQYRIDFGNFECTAGNVRSGNSDEIWEEVDAVSDSSQYFLASEIVEFAFEESKSIEPIGKQFFICAGESVHINAASHNASSYNWFNTSAASEIEIFDPGNYWLERTTECGVFREDFSVESMDFKSDFFSERSITVCQSDLPVFLRSTLNQNLSWSTGEVDSLISIASSGIYWAEYATVCGVFRDSVFVEILELNDIFIPNVITPNGDNLNDCFIVDDQLDGSELVIFGRDGLTIFQSTSYKNNWCPENISSGVYFYQFSSTCYLESYKGWISVKR